MVKWYEKYSENEDIVISSRIRLARNLKKYPFSRKMSPEICKQAVDEIKNTVLNFPSAFTSNFKFISMEDVSQREKLSMLENHIISSELINKKMPCGVIVNEEETINILINEEDHIRIQTIENGFNIDKAWELADKIDDLIEERIEYAFDKEFGYLTSCPTNIGTGLRASVMLHLPMLEIANGLNILTNQLSKFGMTIRGIYGEGSEPLGSIYQISNQVTLGKSEFEIIESLKNITKQIVEQEKQLRNNSIEKNKNAFEDMVYRSYGILKNCKQISSTEAMQLLSKVKLGIDTDILKIDIPKNIFNIMMNIQVGNLQKYIDKENISAYERDAFRAKYLNDIL